MDLDQEWQRWVDSPLSGERSPAFVVTPDGLALQAQQVYRSNRTLFYLELLRAMFPASAHLLGKEGLTHWVERFVSDVALTWDSSRCCILFPNFCLAQYAPRVLCELLRVESMMYRMVGVEGCLVDHFYFPVAALRSKLLSLGDQSFIEAHHTVVVAGFGDQHVQAERFDHWASQIWLRKACGKGHLGWENAIPGHDLTRLRRFPFQFSWNKMGELLSPDLTLQST